MPAQMTITEALAEIKTLVKRIEKKRDVVTTHLCRHEALVDPFAKEEGGSAAVIEREVQAIRDLEDRIVRIRLAILDANSRVRVTVGDEDHTISYWLTWRREVAPKRQLFYQSLANVLQKVRRDAQQKGMTVGVAQAVAHVAGQADKPGNVVVNLDELELTEDIETLEKMLGDLDGKLSLKNATETITIND